MTAELHIIVLNFRTPAYTVACLKSLESEMPSVPGTMVHLIDNGSGDDSVPVIEGEIAQHAWSDWLRFIPLPKNLGFAGGNNVLMREILGMADAPEFVLLLNSDTVVHPGCLKSCLAAMKNNPEVGAMSCLLRNGDGSVQNEARRFPRPDRETVRAIGLPWLAPKLFSWANLDDSSWDRATTIRNVEWIGGAFLLVRTAVLRQVGVLSDEFFFYGEDIEFCYRIHLGGWKIQHNPCGSITHYGGASSGETHIRNHARDLLTWNARFLVQKLCYGKVASIWMRIVYIKIFGLRTLWLFLSGQRNTPKYKSIQGGFRMLLGSLTRKVL
jgi:GT2 family glycosyltransferase